MDGPGIGRSRRRIRVPELRLQQLPTRRIEAAQIRYGRRIMATQLGV